MRFNQITNLTKKNATIWILQEKLANFFPSLLRFSIFIMRNFDTSNSHSYFPSLFFFLLSLSVFCCNAIQILGPF